MFLTTVVKKSTNQAGNNRDRKELPSSEMESFMLLTTLFMCLNNYDYDDVYCMLCDVKI